MTDKTTLVVPGRKLTVSKLLKRSVQVAVALALTATLACVVMMINAAFLPRGGVGIGVNQWLGVIKRPDIQATAILTAMVSVLSVYWQRDRERR